MTVGEVKIAPALFSRETDARVRLDIAEPTPSVARDTARHLARALGAFCRASGVVALTKLLRLVERGVARRIPIVSLGGC